MGVRLGKGSLGLYLGWLLSLMENEMEIAI